MINKYPPASADAALDLLREGNERYRTQGPNRKSDENRRRELQAGQTPFAAILCCSDSRVPPEILFNKRLGDLFVIRNAGNVVDDVVLGSLEYAVAHLGVRLLVILGHENCGAVTATVKNVPTHGHLASILSRIRPAVERVKGRTGDAVALTIDEHIREMLAILRREPEFSTRLVNGELLLVGMRYNLGDGTVTDIE